MKFQQNGRDIYYQDPKLYGSQDTVDAIVDDISCMLAVPRHSLHVVATPKGCIAGDIKFVDADGTYFDCSATKSGLLIPTEVTNISHLQSDAEIVLVIEKEATFHQLLDSDRSDLPPHILITGKGYPDLISRQMVKLLADQLKIPILALVDADPFGIEIMFTYRFGSLSSSYDCVNLAVPSMRWLGLLPSDIQRLCLGDAQLLPLQQLDRKKLDHLLERPYCQPASTSSLATALCYQIGCLHRSDKKAEIESLSSISPTFLASTYIPTKLLKGSWI